MVNILIVGTGEIAARFMVGVKHMEGAKVACVFSRDIANAKKFSRAWNINNFTDDLNKIISEIDIAYISTPTNTHFEVASVLIKKKINVLVEKPIVTDINQLNQLINLAKLNNVNIIDGMWTLYNPLILSACSITKKHTPVSIESSLCFSNIENSKVLTDPENGGAVRDILTYQLYLVALFCNSDELKVVQCQKFFNSKNVDFKYQLKISSNTTFANLYGDIASPGRSNFIVHYCGFDLLIFNPIYNPKFLIFKPTNYLNINVNFMCLLWNFLNLFSTCKILINRFFIKTYFYKNPLHNQLIDLMALISGRSRKSLISLKMTIMVVAILDKLVN